MNVDKPVKHQKVDASTHPQAAEGSRLLERDIVTQSGHHVRRRFIKSMAAAVPAILTIRSGGALASSSGCLTQDQYKGPGETFDPNSPNGYTCLGGTTPTYGVENDTEIVGYTCNSFQVASSAVGSAVVGSTPNFCD